MSTKGLYESAQAAASLFCTFSEGRPALLPVGIDAVDTVVGGLFPGTLGVVAMDTGIGKSRLALAAALRFGELHSKPGERAGIVSLEDPEDLAGSRILAWASGVDSLKIRTKTFNASEKRSLEQGMQRLRTMDERGSAPKFAYRLGASLDEVKEAVKELTDTGCKVIWLDYLQKIRGVSDDRRSEVGRVMTAFQRACFDGGAVAMMISQFVRRDTANEPQLYHLKESGDIENEARLAILGWQHPTLQRAVQCKVAKSAYGGVGTRFKFRTDRSGMLVPFQEYEGADREQSAPEEGEEDVF
jgi:replicative DNA helicase